MADKNILAAGPHCQRTVEEQAGTVQRDTLPCSLTHPSIRQTLEDAHALTSFLQRAAADINNAGEILSNEAANNELWGQHLCFMLLRDKISIALGDLKFPFESIGVEDAPPLWRGPGQTAQP